MRKKEKAAKISIVDPVGYKKLLTFAATGTSTSTKSGSSRTTPPKAPLLSSVNKRRDIISKNGVTKINDGTNVVVSITNPRKPHIVNYVGSKVTCDCEGF